MIVGEVLISLPTALLALFPGCPREARVEAGTVAEAIAALDRSWPGVGSSLCDGSRALRRHIRVYLQGEIAGLDSPVPAGAEVVILTAISGG